MNISGKTKAVEEWIKTFPEIGDYLKLNAVELTDGEKSLQTVYNDRQIQRYIGGGSLKAYTFALVMVCDYSSGFDSVNAQAMEFGERWLDWVDSQRGLGNVPDFGPHCHITEIESLQNAPALAVTYQAEQLAKYQFQAKITYRED